MNKSMALALSSAMNIPLKSDFSMDKLAVAASKLKSSSVSKITDDLGVEYEAGMVRISSVQAYRFLDTFFSDWDMAESNGVMVAGKDVLFPADVFCEVVSESKKKREFIQFVVYPDQSSAVVKNTGLRVKIINLLEP